MLPVQMEHVVYSTLLLFVGDEGGPRMIQCQGKDWRRGAWLDKIGQKTKIETIQLSNELTHILLAQMEQHQFTSYHQHQHQL